MVGEESAAAESGRIPEAGGTRATESGTGKKLRLMASSLTRACGRLLLKACRKRKIETAFPSGIEDTRKLPGATASLPEEESVHVQGTDLLPGRSEETCDNTTEIAASDSVAPEANDQVQDALCVGNGEAQQEAAETDTAAPELGLSAQEADAHVEDETDRSTAAAPTSLEADVSVQGGFQCKEAQELQGKDEHETNSEGAPADAATMEADIGVQPVPDAIKEANDRSTQVQESREDEEPTLAVDARVMLHGLKGASHLNGKKGTIVSYDSSSKRYGVQLDDSKEKKSVKGSNLQPITAPAPQKEEVSRLQMQLQQVRAEKLAAAEAEDFDAAQMAKQKEAALLAELSSLQVQAAASSLTERRTHSVEADAALWEAVRASDLEKLKCSLHEGADPNARNSLGETPLFEAVAQGRAGFISELVAARANPFLESHKCKSVHMMTNDAALRRLLGAPPPLQQVRESEWLRFCQHAVPGWRDLPSGVTLRSRGFAEGKSSNIQMVDLLGPGKEQVSPNACVYGYLGAFLLSHMGNLDDVQRIRNQIGVMAGKAGLGPQMYAAVGRHWVTEYFPGQPLARGGGGHFLSTLGGWFHSGGMAHGSDAREMAQLGKVIGSIHALPTDWLEDVVGTVKLAEYVDVLRSCLPPEFGKFIHKELLQLVERAIDLKCFPHTGLFARPVMNHGDLHRGNMLQAEDGTFCFVDWELAFIGNRGYDLGYFLSNCYGATAESKQSFARAYLSACGFEEEITQEVVANFLQDLDRCRILGLLGNLFISALLMPFVAGNIVRMIKEQLNAAGRQHLAEAGRSDAPQPTHSEPPEDEEEDDYEFTSENSTASGDERVQQGE